MRVWDIHPGYLSRQSLLGQHAEIHAMRSVIVNQKKGYGSHPETLRWKGQLGRLKLRHYLTVKEMVLRGFGHNSPWEGDHPETVDRLTFVDPPGVQVELLREKYREKSTTGRIPLPQNSSQFWAHHKYSVMGRGYQHYREIQAYLKGRSSRPLDQEADFILNIISLLELPPPEKAVRNVTDHLWGYFKREALPEEKARYQAMHWENRDAMPFLFSLAQKYQKTYLLHSTVFADLL